jgi:Mn2+/Fe2+ NRAMP family transporter
MSSRLWTRPGQFGLILLMILCALALWIGSPVLWLWVGSHVTDRQQAGFGPYMLVAIGILGSTVALVMALARLNRLYERLAGHDTTVRVPIAWLRSLRGEKEQVRRITVLDLIMITSAIAAITAFAVWFLLFAGSSLPG